MLLMCDRVLVALCIFRRLGAPESYLLQQIFDVSTVSHGQVPDGVASLAQQNNQGAWDKDLI